MGGTGRARGLAEGALVETAEGPVAMVETPNKGFAVLTRLPGGGLGFRQLIKLVRLDDVELVRVALESGHAVVGASGHPFHRADGSVVAASDLRPGDALATAFRYPEGYLPAGMTSVSTAWGIAVRAVEAAGRGAVLTGTVRDTHVMYLTAGVLCGE